MTKKIGGQSIQFENPVRVLSTASVVGPKEAEGPLAARFDVKLTDILAGEKTWEKAESAIVKQALTLAIRKAGLETSQIEYLLTGDLLNQDAGSNFGVKDLQIPFFGLFGACSTMGESMSLGAMLIDGGFAEYVLVGASSHFCASEKQFRFPLDLGTQRAPTASWTVTGDGCAVLGRSDEKNGTGTVITAVTTGKIVDMGVKDINNMGAAMAPAAASTMAAHFKDFGRGPEYYDLIATGDLGYVGRDLLVKLMEEEGYQLGSRYTDCGILIFDREKQDTDAGGSGCGCSAVTFAGDFYSRLQSGELKKILFIPTGALMSPTTTQQGENIPGIAHAVVLESGAL